MLGTVSIVEKFSMFLKAVKCEDCPHKFFKIHRANSSAMNSILYIIMGTNTKRWTLLLLCILGIVSFSFSQAVYTVKNTDKSKMILSGTSTLHEWEMESESAVGEAQFIFNLGKSKELIGIKTLSFALHVTDLKSDSEGLDKNAYSALKSGNYKDINYKLTSAVVSSEREGFLVSSIGNLTIAGITNIIVMDVHCTVNVDGTITTKGVYKLNMTDYGVDPPSFMWGAMSTGDAVTFHFEIIYKK